MTLDTTGPAAGATVRTHDDGRVEVIDAPPLAEFSLELLTQGGPCVIRVDEAGYLDLAGQVAYRPLRFRQPLAGPPVLVCERVR